MTMEVMDEKRDNTFSWLRKSRMLFYSKKGEFLDAKKLVDADCYVDKTQGIYL